MSNAKCPKCQSENLIKKNGKFKCQDCGYQLTDEEAQSIFNSASSEPRAKETKGNYPIAYLECDQTRIESVENFIEDLIQKENIPVDVYDKINDLKNKIVYIPFYRANIEYSCDYSGTACWRRQEPYQDWETYTEWIDGKSYTRRRQVTRYRTVIDRQPFNGNFSDSGGNSESMSVEYADFMSKLDLSRSLNELKTLLVGDNFTINGKDVELNTITALKTAKDAAIKHTVELIHSAAGAEVGRREQGDYSENVRWNIKVDSSVDSIIYVPVQKISFSYNGQYYYKYNSINDTFADSDENLPTQDYDTVDFVASETKSIKELANNIENKTKKKRNKYIYKGWAFAVVAAIYIVMLIGVYINSNFAYDNKIVLSVIIGILGLGGAGFTIFKERGISKIQDDVINYQTNEINDFTALKDKIEGIRKEKITNFMDKSKSAFLDIFREKYEKTIFNDNSTWGLTFDERNTQIDVVGDSNYDTSIHVNDTNEKNNKTINMFNLIVVLAIVVTLIPLGYIIGVVNSPNIKDEYGNILKNQWVECYDGHWYYVDSYGNKLCNQWFDDSGVWYHFNNVGWLDKGTWVKYNSNGSQKWSYVDSEGKMVTNVTIDGYSIDSNGYANR